MAKLNARLDLFEVLVLIVAGRRLCGGQVLRQLSEAGLVVRNLGFAFCDLPLCMCNLILTLFDRFGPLKR